MIPDEIEIVVDDISYLWEFDEDETRPERSWRWSRVVDEMEPSESVRGLLNKTFIEDYAKAISEGIDDDAARKQFGKVLSAMGASKKQLIDLGFFALVQEMDFSFACEEVLSELPAAARTLVNCPVLRNRFFQANPASRFAFSVALVGTGPFTLNDFVEFLASQNVAIDDSSENTEVVVCGRNDWGKQQIDDLIEDATGRCLRFYSQEMFLSVLAGQPDPFETIDAKDQAFVFSAFRAGHPTLDYVSQGWAGWVKAFVRADRSIASSSASTFDRADESPLHTMGYHVGKSGVDAQERQAILSAAFRSNVLPVVESARYMEDWAQGHGGSGARLERIATHIVQNIENTVNRSDAARYEQAIVDWLNDLAWMKAEFYQGAMAFDWPSAIPPNY
ncbi:hypothetical protein Enr13x_32620 [Stieleria neptunia]|uniref:Uncharacterized protein n=1 Tax=Stieleria neptunia TaxID=2527979 RepID=A0A518HRD4_9BACT|nr:hypothetical protein [Stieleria neptunia]QDV43406.1 hypothetical protein Enr13x_32620 [Stieleria neptunia]